MKNISRYAKFDPAYLADGLFKPRANLEKGVDISRDYGSGEIRFLGLQLGAAHQSVLLALCARTGRDGVHIIGDAKDLRGYQMSLQLEMQEIEKELKIALDPSLEYKYPAHSTVEATAYSLLIDAGLDDSGKGYKQLVKYLTELAQMTIYRRAGKNGGITRLLSFRHDGDRMTVNLNWRLANAIFGQQNIQISLHERIRLSSPVSKILHAWLSGYIRLGQSLMNGQGANIDTLAKHVWGDTSKAADRKAMYKRRIQVRDALKEIGKLPGWVIDIKGSKALITRPTELPFYDDIGTPGQTAEFIKFNQEPIDPEL